LDKEVLIRHMEKQLSDNDNIICCFDSKAEMEIVVQRLKRYCEENQLANQLKNFVVYSSTEGDEKDFLQINDKWKGKNVFYTPKITFGISFDNKIPRNIYMIALGISINAFGYVQQISRCRNIKELHYYIANRSCGLKYNSVEDVTTYYTGLLGKFESLYKEGMQFEIDTDNLSINIPDCVKIKELFDNHCIVMNDQTCKWSITDSVFTTIFFINEYYDNVLRSAPREQFRWLIESKGFTVIYNKEKVIDKAKVEAMKDIKLCKDMIEEQKEILGHRAIFDKLASLTDSEKIIRQFAINRAKYLEIDFESKVEKKRYEDFLVDRKPHDKMFTQHYMYRLLMGEGKVDEISAKQLKKLYNIKNGKSLLVKVRLIKRLERALNIESLKIDTKEDYDRFDEEVDVPNDLRKKIVRIFRVTKETSDDMLEQFRYWYYQLIHMYKHVFSIDLFTSVQIKRNKIHHYSYSINPEYLEIHKELL